jgi:hypothetical protein
LEADFISLPGLQLLASLMGGLLIRKPSPEVAGAGNTVKEYSEINVDDCCNL